VYPGGAPPYAPFGYFTFRFGFSPVLRFTGLPGLPGLPGLFSTFEGIFIIYYCIFGAFVHPHIIDK
jgi:hypothetical protein